MQLRVVRMDRYRGFGFALAAYHDILFTDDDETGEGDPLQIARQRIVKIEGFTERVVPATNDQMFKSYILANAIAWHCCQ